ncbi:MULTISPECIES: PVC-type heme-binding CxxCH protein [Pirellulaceae]|nr:MULTISPECIES: PVC-type heme-binding CxxCH protein [Pirellulaceae]
MLRYPLLASFFLFLACCQANANDANRLTYLDQFCDPYYVGRDFPKLTTPQWIGDDKVEGVVVLAIDDLRDTAKYEAYLRPIFERLKKINGSASVSIMTNSVDVNNPILQTWLAEGVGLDAHTATHPCPCLQGGDFEAGKRSYEDCVDMLFSIPNSRPVAFRFPCMDSKNTPSPRMIAEVLASTTEKGNFLQIDSSVVIAHTADDPELPRDLVIDADGQGRFTKYIPFPSFVNKVENYPYPYVIGRKIWEFPCTIPDDWQGFNLQQPGNPKTVEDWKASMDAAVLKQGTASFVFHPHGWIRTEQMIEIINHAVNRHGDRVAFLQFSQCLDRVNQHLLKGQPLRDANGEDNGVRLLDLNADGYMDVVIGNDQLQVTRIWRPAERAWLEAAFPVKLVTTSEGGKQRKERVRFGIQYGEVIAVAADESIRSAWRFKDNAWTEDRDLLRGLELDGKPVQLATAGIDQGVRFRDLNNDGDCELIVGSETKQGIFQWNRRKQAWDLLPFELPDDTEITFSHGLDAGLRFVDVDEDGFDDVVFSDEVRYSLSLFKSMKEGWSRQVSSGLRGDDGAIPMISRLGTNNGAWFADNSIWIQNEDTSRLPDGVDRMSFVEMLRPIDTQPKTADASHKTIRTQPGFRIDQVAAEPLVMDPVSFDWGPDGKFWVVEMADYPLGVDGKPGGRVRYLHDVDRDGTYDKSVLFLEDLNFPNGVMAWGKGVLVSAAPEIFYAEDTDGDGKADKRETLYVGFKEGNQQHRVNGFWRGLDNWIYIANGDSGGTVRAVKTGKTLDINGRDLRIRPDTGEMEAVTGQSQYGRASDDWGNWFGCNNSQAVYHYVTDDHYYLRNPSVPMQRPIQRIASVDNTPIFPRSRILSHWSGYKPPAPGEPSRFTSANGICIYRDERLGPGFEISAFVSEPVHNLIHRHQLTPQEVTFSGHRAPGEDRSEFVASSDSWFRPAAIRTGPNGGIWFADMYRLVLEHPQWIDDEEEKRIDLRAGHDKGRIYRILPVTEEPSAVPYFDSLTNLELTEQLASSNGWRRDMAQHLLIERSASDVVPALAKLTQTSENPLGRLHALCALDGLNALTSDVLAAAFSDPHAGVRRHAIRLAETTLDADAALQGALSARLDDPDPMVALQLAYSLGQWHSSDSGRLLAKLAVMHRDEPHIVSAALTSLNAENILSAYSEMISSDVTAGPDSPILYEMMRIGAGFKQPKIVESMAAALLQEDGSSLSTWKRKAIAQLMGAARKNGAAWQDSLSADNRGKLTAEIGAARNRLDDLESTDDDIRMDINLVLQAGGNSAEDILLIASLLEPQTRSGLQIAAIQELAKVESDLAAQELFSGWPGYTPAVRKELLETVLTRTSWSLKLLREIEHQRISPADLGSDARKRLLEHPNKEIATLARAQLAQSSTASRAEVMQRYESAWQRNTGDVQKGRVLFVTHCSVCHRLEGKGFNVGPDLTGLTNKSPEALAVAILDPNRAVEDKFIEYATVTDDGRTFSGILASESGTSVTLRGQGGKEQTVLREEIEHLRSTSRSLMPEGFEQVLDPQALSDLIRYIAEAKAE